jgi:lactoylglutathione lyase
MATKKAASKKSTAKASAAKPAAKPAKSAKREALKLKSASPGFTVNDVEKSLAWYRDILGFTVGERWEDKGKLLGVEVSAGDVLIMLGQDDWKKGRNRAKGEGFRVFCETDQDIDRLAGQIKASGGKLTQEPADQPWGMRDLSVDDPDGFKLTIARKLKKK